MTDSKHTPGPWVKTIDRDGDFLISSNSGEYDITTIFQWEDVPDESIANARLIAAAPELLEALDGLIRDHDDPMSASTSKWFWDQARAAITKATGN